MRTRLKGAFERFIDVDAGGDFESAKLLRALEVDIAVDLMGFTQGCRPGILAPHPAPLQVGFLGYPGTIGAAFIDYIIADGVVVPEESRAFYSEKVVHLPGCCLPNGPRKVAETVSANCALTQADEAIVAMTTAFNCVVAPLVAGEKFDANLSDRLMDQVRGGYLPFHMVTGENLTMPRPGDPDPPRAGKFSSPDALLTPSHMAEAAQDPDIRIEPAWKVSLVYGMPCAIYHQLPAAYYLAARFRHDFESAILHALNGGGQNMSRACLTGALVGAQVGLSGIPERFIDGLENHRELVKLARQLGELTEADQPVG